MGAKNGKPVLRKEDIASFAKSTGLSEDQVSKLIVYYCNDTELKKRFSSFRLNKLLMNSSMIIQMAKSARMNLELR